MPTIGATAQNSYTPREMPALPAIKSKNTRVYAAPNRTTYLMCKFLKVPLGLHKKMRLRNVHYEGPGWESVDASSNHRGESINVE